MAGHERDHHAALPSCLNLATVGHRDFSHPYLISAFGQAAVAGLWHCHQDRANHTHPHDRAYDRGALIIGQITAAKKFDRVRESLDMVPNGTIIMAVGADADVLRFSAPLPEAFHE